MDETIAIFVSIPYAASAFLCHFFLNKLLSLWVYTLELYTYFFHDVEPERSAIMTPAKVIQSMPITCNLAIG